ncbi:MAG: hypothetical protein HYY58_02135 [Candidatus Omnitrophica bacterium]|nr:hypothetical protein [Candidatus Omnitrophota bacterium]
MAKPACASGSASTDVESCCELHPPVTCGPTPCPACGPEARARIPAQEEFCFCKTADCEVVYFRDGEALFQKNDVAVRLGLKEPNNSHAPVCYCFGWTPKKIGEEIERTGQSSVIEQIKSQVKSGNCYCEVTNPQGSCCLGNVSRAVKQASATASRT